MRLADDDKLDKAVFIAPGMNPTYEYKGRIVALDKLRIGQRDTKGTKK